MAVVSRCVLKMSDDFKDVIERYCSLPDVLAREKHHKTLEREPHGVDCANAVMKIVRVALMCCVEKRLLLRLE